MRMFYWTFENYFFNIIFKNVNLLFKGLSESKFIFVLIHKRILSKSESALSSEWFLYL